MRALVLCLVVASGCARFFTPPCQQVAREICNVGPEGDACAFVLNVKREDERAQAVCKDILPSAKALAADPTGGHAGWVPSRARLAELGFAADPKKGRIEEKLKAFGGEGGRMVEKIENAYDAAERNRVEGAERALEGMNQ